MKNPTRRQIDIWLQIAKTGCDELGDPVALDERLEAARHALPYMRNLDEDLVEDDVTAKFKVAI